MKIIFLNKEEKEALENLLMQLVAQPKCSYELTTILEKLNRKAYECAFNCPELTKQMFDSFQKS